MIFQDLRTVLQAAFGFGDYKPLHGTRLMGGKPESELDRMNRAAQSLQSEAAAFQCKGDPEAFGRTLEQVAKDL